LNLSWTRGEGPFQVQETTSLSSPAWANVGNPMNGTNLLTPHDGASGFFRITGQ